MLRAEQLIEVIREGTSHGEHKDGSWRAGMPEWGARLGRELAGTDEGTRTAATDGLFKQYLLVPLGEARLGCIDFDEWFRRSQAAA